MKEKNVHISLTEQSSNPPFDKTLAHNKTASLPTAENNMPHIPGWLVF
jgi:hypothetical protein